MAGHFSKTSSRRGLKSVLIASTMLMSGAASAQADQAAPQQNAERSSDADIIVTATKRAESIQDIPLSVTALSEETLTRSGATSFENYATAVPNLSFGYSGAGRQVSRTFQIRGITGAGTSALYIGETPVPTSIDPRVIDLDRIEVLRGPQGSLFGARSMGGLVRLIPTSPDVTDFSGKAHLSGAKVNKGGWDFAADGTINAPLSEKAALRITAYYLREAGFIDRLVDPDASDIIRPTATSVPFLNGDEHLHKNINSADTYGFQAALSLKPTETITITPRVLFQNTRSDGPNFVDNDIHNFTKVRQFDTAEIGRDKWWLASLEANIDVGVGTIFSSTSYFHRSAFDSEDASIFYSQGFGSRPRNVLGAPSTEDQRVIDRRVTQETRFASDFDGPFNFIAGVFYQHLNGDSSYLPSIVPANSRIIGIAGIAQGDTFFSLNQKNKSNEYGVFGEATLKLASTLKLTAGGRYYVVKGTNTRQDGGVLYTKLFGITPIQFAGKTSDKGFNPRVALTWEPSDATTVYLNAAKGFRPGAPNLGKSVCEANGFKNVPDVVKSDSLWNYEAGLKNKLFGGRLSTDLAVYKIVWKNRRTTVVSDCGLGFGYADNVGEAQSEGFEFSAAATLAPGVKLDGGLGYTNSRITDTGGVPNVVVGTRLPDVPRWSGGAAIDLSHGFDRVESYARVDYRYVGPSISAQGNPRPQYSLVNARLGARFGAFDVSIFANNLFDKRANLSDPPELSDALNLIAVNRPRTIGVDLRARF